MQFSVIPVEQKGGMMLMVNQKEGCIDGLCGTHCFGGTHESCAFKRAGEVTCCAIVRKFPLHPPKTPSHYPCLCLSFVLYKNTDSVVWRSPPVCLSFIAYTTIFLVGFPHRLLFFFAVLYFSSACFYRQLATHRETEDVVLFVFLIIFLVLSLLSLF